MNDAGRAPAKKIAACGLHIRRRVAVHGFALNVTDEILPLFDLVVPCGLAGTAVTSIERELAITPPALSAIAETLAPRISRALFRAPEPSHARFLA